jgi:hypothetical protein
MITINKGIHLMKRLRKHSFFVKTYQRTNTPIARRLELFNLFTGRKKPMTSNFFKYILVYNLKN